MSIARFLSIGLLFITGTFSYEPLWAASPSAANTFVMCASTR